MNNSLSASPENSDIQEWQCPYCEQTRQTLRDLREHITDSTDGEHHGVDGLKPTRDIIAYGTDGQEVDRVEGESTEPADPLDSYDKRELIINAWIAADRDPDRKAVQAITGASQQYVSRLVNELESGDIPRETWIDVLDYGLGDELKERLEQYESDSEPAEEEDTSMSAQATVEDIIEDAAKKDRILALHEVAPSIDKKAAADSLGVSYEYVRQIFNDLEKRDPDEWQKLRDGDQEKDLPVELLDAVETRLREDGVLADGSDVGGAYNDDEEPATASHRTQSASMTEIPPVESVKEVRKRMQLLLDQAQHVGNTEAEFVAKKGVEWMDELVESAE